MIEKAKVDISDIYMAMNVKRMPQEIIGNRDIGAVALDIDGTMVNQYEEMPDEIIDVIRGLLDAKVHVVICTARSIESVLRLFNKFFSEEEIGLFGYVTLGGSHSYHIVYKNHNPIQKILYAHSYNLERIYRVHEVQNFLRRNPRFVEKATSLLVDIGDTVKAKRKVRLLCKKLKSSPLRAYQYHDKVCISLKLFDKEKGLHEYLKIAGVPVHSVVCIADQGALFEADYEFLRNPLGFTVGSSDMSNNNGCHCVYSSVAEIILSLSATAIVLRAVLANVNSKKDGRRNRNESKNRK